MAEFVMNIDPDYDHILTEYGNSFVALRKIQWKAGGDYKLDLRKWDIKSDGEEQCRKGICFNDDTANELVNTLLATGYGETEEILKTLSERDDFDISAAHALSSDRICLIQKIQEEEPIEPIDEIEIYDIKGDFIDE